MTGDVGQQRSFHSITAAEARKKMEDGNVQIVDVRPPFDFAGGHIPNSLSLPGQALRTRAAQLSPDREILIVNSPSSASKEIPYDFRVTATILNSLSQHIRKARAEPKVHTIRGLQHLQSHLCGHLAILRCY